MPRKKHSELKAGLFVLFSVAILVGLVIWMGNYVPLIGADGKHAWFYSDVKNGPVGLIENSDVKFGDLHVGRIEGVVPDYKNGRVYFKVRFKTDGFTLHDDGGAEVISGMLGNSALVIKNLGGSEEAVPASDMKNAIAIEPGGMQAALNNMRTISEELRRELDASDQLSLIARVKATIARLEGTAKNIEKISNGLIPELDFNKKGTTAAMIKQTLKNLSSTTSTIDTYTHKDLSVILATLRKVSTSVLETANNLNVTSKEAKELLVENSGSLDRMIDDMAMLAADLKATGKEVRRNPWMLLYQPDDGETKEAELFQSARAFENAATELRIVTARLEALKKLSPGDDKTDEKIREVRAYMLRLFDEFRKVEDVFWKRLSKINGGKTIKQMQEEKNRQ